jgi:hypothetical protein
MACIIKLSNVVFKVSKLEDQPEDSGECFTSDWTAYVEGELAASNKNDNFTLGGAQNGGEFSEEEEPA